MEFSQQFLDDLIDKYLERKEREREIGVYYPSEMGNCLRKTYLSFKYPKKPTKDVLRIFAIGNLFHEFISEVLSKSNLEFHKSELEICLMHPNNDIILSGRADNLIILKDSKKRILLEIKTVASFKTKDGKELNAPLVHHIIQIAPYYKGLRCNEAFILYIEKTTFKTKLFKVDNVAGRMPDLLKNTQKLHEALIKGIIPPKIESWECFYCNYNSECEKESIENKHV